VKKTQVNAKTPRRREKKTISSLLASWRLGVHLIFLAFIAGAPTTTPTTNPALWNRLVEIDSRAQQITDLMADFDQQKFTTLLKKPLISRGQVRVAGATMRWDTAKPEPSVMLIDEKEVKLYYPNQKTLEVYALGQQFGSLAASPLPKLSVLREHFAFESDDPAAEQISVRLTPTDKALQEHVERVTVLLEAARGLVLRGEIEDADGDKTVMTFTNIRTNSGVKESDLRLEVPPDVKITRPLGALE
jgi:outer membrane lipoprotein-sorting protein